ncbi:unnamed protein product [Staurois parvus]|uniref:Uncharacterized protein n=1 Tax=Staurois parvus TaxID=386267 RepID=A0ABN9AR84_9NEOB|nr:unnamed protein product [Staurois parvus]
MPSTWGGALGQVIKHVIPPHVTAHAQIFFIGKKIGRFADNCRENWPISKIGRFFFQIS